MSLENLEQDLDAFKAVLEDFNSGKLKLQNGQDEFLADLKMRIAALEARIYGRGSLADGPLDGGSLADGSLDGEYRAAG